MAFNPAKYNIEEWLELEDKNMLQKFCSIFDNDGFLVGQYKTRVFIVPEGNAYIYGSARGKIAGHAPALYRSYSYDDEGNQVASVPQIAEWTQACESAANGGILDPEFPGGIPAGLKIATSTPIRVVNSIATTIEATVGEYEVPVDTVVHLLKVSVNSCNRGVWKIFRDTEHLMTRTTTWTRFSEVLDFSTANGGIKFEAGEKIILKALNNGVTTEDFEGTFIIVDNPVT